MEQRISIIFSVLILASCTASYQPQDITKAEDQFAEIPFNFEFVADSLPTLEHSGNIVITAHSLIPIDEVNLNVNTTGVVHLAGESLWTGSLVANQSVDIVFPLEAEEEGQALIIITMAGLIRDINMWRRVALTISVGKRGTILEETQITSTPMGE